MERRISMYPHQIHDYLRHFFTETGCPILTENDHYMIVQLTVDMDKKIMNRPFYWHYIESTGGEPQPAQLTLITDKNKIADNIFGEVVHFGSPRLSQLFQTTKEMGAFVQLYEEGFGNREAILTPWLGVNYKVSYCYNRTKEMLYSLGINLMTGQRIEDFHEVLRDKELRNRPPENTFTLPYTIKPLRALDRLNDVVERFIQQDDHSWAEEAKKRWVREQRVLDHFYEGVEVKPDSYEVEKEALEQQYEPKIKIDIINGGLFYLR